MLTIRQGADQPGESSDWIGPAPEVNIPPPGPKAYAAISRDEEVTSPSHTRFYPLAAARASGSVVEDLDGNRFLDFAAGIAVCSTGHCHPKVVRAIQEQAGKLIHLCGSDFYYEPQAELCRKLSEIAPGDGPRKVFLGNSGTEAVEAAMKLSRWHTRRDWIIAFYGAFHGRTLGSLSLTCSKVLQRDGFGPSLPMVVHAPYGDADFIENYIFKHTASPKSVAAIFVEAFQGEGGYRIPPPGFLERLRSICDEHGICLVADEIQSGAGRTGKWWAVDHEGVVPDILLSGKGLASGMPLSAVIAKPEIMNWPEGAHGSTFGGNPVCCAAANATLKLIGETYMSNAESLGRVCLEILEGMKSRHSCVDAPRGRGLMIGVDIVENKRAHKPAPELRDRICQEAFRRGLILLPAGETTIRVCPPLCMNKVQLEVGLNVLEEAIATVAK